MEAGKETRGDTVFRGIAWSAFACSANTSCVDVKDDKILRIRPLHYDDVASVDERKPWRIEARGKVFEPGEKTMIPPLSISYKKRIYSKNRILHPMKRVDWDPKGERNPQNRGKSKYVRISWDEATQIIADEIKRVHDTTEQGLSRRPAQGPSRTIPQAAQLKRAPLRSPRADEEILARRAEPGKASRKIL